MFPRAQSTYFQRNQRGSMLVISLFVIVVMALLVLTLTRLLSASGDTLIYEVYGLRAHQAAKSGLEQHLELVFPVGSEVSDPSTCETDNGDPSDDPLPQSGGPEFSAIPGFQGCEYQSRCIYDPDATERHYQFTSTGTCEAGDAVTARTVSVDARVEL